MTKDVKFFRTESHTISAEEAKRLNSPKVIGQELVLNVKGWIEKALATLSGHSDLRPAVNLEAPDWIDLAVTDHAIHELHRICIQLPRYMPAASRMKALTCDEKNAVEVLYRTRQLSNTLWGLGVPAASAVVIIKASFNLGIMAAKAHADPWEEFAESGWKSKEGGGEGGKANKRRKWADAVAAHLLENLAGKSKKEIWAAIGNSADISEIESDFGDI
jgi:hypothetical protein